MGFEGGRVLAFESRRAAEIAELIRRQGGVPSVAPALKETPLEDHGPVDTFASRLVAGEYDMVVLMTGVGTRQLNAAIATRHGASAFADALRRVTVVARGPKPVAALREMGVQPDLAAPPPNTWREVLDVTASRPERRIAIQEYGRENPELIEGFRNRGAEVETVRIYRYAMPDDTGPLREAARELAEGRFDAVLFTTAVQIDHLLRVAREQGVEERVLQALRNTFCASIGPTTSEALREFGVEPRFEPSQAKMGLLVREAAERARG
jgi:uroporphyrinogen-III synthase